MSVMPTTSRLIWRLLIALLLLSLPLLLVNTMFGKKKETKHPLTEAIKKIKERNQKTQEAIEFMRGYNSK